MSKKIGEEIMAELDIKEIASDIARHGHLVENASMKDFTTFKTGGNADLLIYPRSIEDAASIIRYANDKKVPLMVIGGGSNLVVGDRGIRGIVIRMAEDNIMTGIIEEKKDRYIYADSILKKRDLIEYAASRGYAGTEFMAGIPGCVGGGIFMNAGTFMGNFIDIIDRVLFITRSGEIRDIHLDRAMGHYRGIDIDDLALIWGGFFMFKETRSAEELRLKIDEINADRLKKHPQNPSAGSVFKNPDGHSSWKLVDDAGLKGKRIGGAMVSELHTNFIINAGGATSRDVRDLIDFVRKTVMAKFGVDLHPEVKIIGEF
jgi:UDP-N-acetylmuramate dehydrogenase